MDGIKKEIKYVAFYDIEDIKRENRQTNLAATNKIDYICSVLVKNNYRVKIISPSWTKNVKGFYNGKIKDISENIKLKIFSTFGVKTRPMRLLKYKFSLLQVFIYLLVNIKAYETIIVYHSPSLINLIKLIKKIKRCKVILEVEEIYSDVWKNSKYREKEMSVINIADKYILVSDLLKNMLPKKDSIVLYGSYNVLNIVKKEKSKKQINIVYAGSIDKTKGGAFNSILCSKHLDDSYRIKICGFGKEKNIIEMKNLIDDINKEKGFIFCKYYGTLIGKEYDDFMMNCDIALNPQNQGKYMNTAFPSKVLSYLSYDLRVVSTRVESVMSSEISDLIEFADGDSPLQVAKAIKKIDLKDDYDSSNVIYNLDKLFNDKIRLLLR